MMNALDLLFQDHQSLRSLFEQVQQTADSVEKRELYEQIKVEFLSHVEGVQSHLFPAFLKDVELAELIDEVMVEQDEIRDLFEDIDEAHDTEEISDLLDELRDAVEHHIAEEEGTLVAKLQQVAPVELLQQIGEKMVAGRTSPRRAA